MKQISVVISSLRPEQLELTIDSTAMHQDIIEVVVVSPWAPKARDFVKHIPIPLPPTGGDPAEREKQGELSLSKKYNMALSRAEGQYLVFHNDDLHFRAGWVPALLEHMRKNNATHPYLAAFHFANKGAIDPRYTVFGMLYANLGCIAKSDLALVGGYLYDERMRTECVDPDLSLRVWATGGRVGICSDVVIDIDTYTKLHRSVPDPLCTPYKGFWATEDFAVFYDLWFWKYFWLFFKNYAKLTKKLTYSDGVVSKEMHNSGAFRIFAKPLLKLALYSLLRNDSKIKSAKRHLARLVNRKWATLDYDLPYDPKSVIRSEA